METINNIINGLKKAHGFLSTIIVKKYIDRGLTNAMDMYLGVFEEYKKVIPDISKLIIKHKEPIIAGLENLQAVIKIVSENKELKNQVNEFFKNISKLQEAERDILDIEEKIQKGLKTSLEPLGKKLEILGKEIEKDLESI